MSLIDVSGNLLYVAFVAYLVATLLFGGAIRSPKTAIGDTKTSNTRWGNIAIVVAMIGFLAHLGYFITRWIYTGHAPVSNMFEFTTAFGMFIVLAFIVMYFMYRVAVLGVIALPIALLIIAYASVFPKEVSPLVPSLKSDWLTYHVICAALGEAILAISAVAGLIYLLKNVDVNVKSKERFFLEAIMYTCVLVLGFVATSIVFNNYSAHYEYVDKTGTTRYIEYTNPALFGMNESKQVTLVDFQAGEYRDATAEEAKFSPLADMPPLINAKKLTTVVWSIIFGTLLYVLIRLIGRRSISAMLQPLVKKANSQLMDEIGYRAVLIGFPIFSLGALLFAMIWAQIAWSRYWGWDPKEVWALITFLFYAAYLHLRFAKGWEGRKSAWLAVIGFAIIMFNLVAVNLILAGLHSYA